MECHSRQFAKAFSDVEVTQGAHFEERHVVLGGVDFRIAFLHLSLEGEVQAIAYQDLWNTWCMLFNFLKPPIYAVKGPFIGDVINKQYALRPTGVRSYDRTKAALSRRVP